MIRLGLVQKVSQQVDLQVTPCKREITINIIIWQLPRPPTVRTQRLRLPSVEKKMHLHKWKTDFGAGFTLRLFLAFRCCLFVYLLSLCLLPVAPSPPSLSLLLSAHFAYSTFFCIHFFAVARCGFSAAFLCTSNECLCVYMYIEYIYIYCIVCSMHIKWVRALHLPRLPSACYRWSREGKRVQ